jgi:anti-sigma factor ChrR (cupin superfamily)
MASRSSSAGSRNGGLRNGRRIPPPTPAVLPPAPLVLLVEDDHDWKDVAPGIACKLLATDTQKSRVSMLVRLAPGTDYPPHRHAGVEELYMLHGELIVDHEKFYPGDYRRTEAGVVDHRVWSETGCTCLLVISIHDVIL